MTPLCVETGDTKQNVRPQWYCYRAKNGGERVVLWTGLDARCLRIFCLEKNQVQNVVLVVRGRALYIGASESKVGLKYDSTYQTSYRSMLRSNR